MKFNLRIALLAGVATAGFGINSAAAQDVPDAQAQQAPQPADENEIIVTANKRAERLQDVPASVSVVRADTLAREGIVRFSDYASRIPGMSLTSARTGSAQVTLRGITTGAAQPGSTTGYYVDEAPVGSVNAYTGGSGITPDLDPSDLAQIEVLKGPQGTLYGAGAVGGLLKFTTMTPDLDTLEGRASAGINTVSHGEVGFSGRAMLNLPLEPGELGLRVSGFYRRDPGFIDNVNPLIGDNDVNRASVYGGRAMLGMKLGPDVSLNVSALLQDTRTGASNTVDVDAATLEPIYGELEQNRYVKETGQVRLRLYNATLNVDFDPVQLVSSTTYQRIYFEEIGDATRSYGAFLGGLFGLGSTLGVRLPTYKHTERWSQELRASSNGLIGGALDLQGGFYWTREVGQNWIPGMQTFSTVTGQPIPFPQIAVASIDSTYEEYSFFGNARVHFGDRFDILGGIRFSHDDQTYLQDYAGLIVGNVHLVVPGGEKADVTTWLVSPRFRISDNLMVYGRAATGYRPGGPNPAPPTGNIPLTFDPDQLTQYEIGLKASTGDHTLSVDAALFYTDWNHVQIQTSGGGFNYLVNGGTARSQGGELTLRYEPVHALLLGANLAYTDAKLTENAPAAGGLDGDRLPYVPRWAGSLTADYSVEIGGTNRLTFGGSFNYVGDRVSDYSQKFPKPLDAYATFDLRAGIEGGPWSLTAFVRNVTDERAIVVTGQQGLAPSNTPGAFYSAAYIQPRVIGAEASVHF